MGKRESLQALGARLRLPALPGVVARINAMIVDHSCGPQDIGRVLGEDPALTASVLSIANSSLYGLQEEVLSTEQAATVIGVRSLRNIVMQASIVRRYEHLSDQDVLDLDEIWAHAMTSAQLCQMLGTAARRSSGLAPDGFHTCGLLHDVGKVVLLDSLGAQYGDILRAARASVRPLHHVEQEQLGFSHVDVGALVSARWKLPKSVALAIAYHHGPTSRVLAHPAVAAVAVADQLSYRAEGSGFEQAVEQLALVAQRALDLTPEAFERVVEASQARCTDARAA